ncbi:hypothetical protein F8O01_16960 [Pseudoclavibacter chungangensis]|uniref:Uncharacterized protein n=1 Tax=Pseudoclavibacter chungangensis TaxID=587635 RepID=A0A7J5BML7_9MICO|nr:hypothetical protein [Pseudoclavibacter chungangensis]KAB1652316.1 hypothetical protein F8O01_16960 [Pseudoclavibacter chungangensis]NYJ66898.1 hypothetical protein [Pseudoclavibacter chungangensis]
MTNVDYRDGTLHVTFTGWEGLMAGRSAIAVPRGAILGARSTDGWTTEILGMRSGLVVSGFRKVGVFTHPSGIRRLVSMSRGVPLLRVGVDRTTTGFDELLLSTPHASAIARAIMSGVPA